MLWKYMSISCCFGCEMNTKNKILKVLREVCSEARRRRIAGYLPLAQAGAPSAPIARAEQC